jgi:hypothetical protein
MDAQEKRVGLQQAGVTHLLPPHGQTIIFLQVPPGSYCKPNKAYRVERSDNVGDFRFVNDRNGTGIFDKPSAVAHSTWKVASVG